MPLLRPLPRCPRRATPSFQLDLIILDQRIGEELVGRLLKRGARRFAVAPFELDVEDFPLADARYARNAQRFERALNRLPLRVENPGFESDGDAGLHRLSCTHRYGANPGKCKKSAQPGFRSIRATLRYDHPFTRTGPMPRGRSPSLMMPRRLATSV